MYILKSADPPVSGDGADVVLFVDDVLLVDGIVVVDGGDGLTSSTSIRVTSEPTESRCVLSKHCCKVSNSIFVVRLCSPCREINCGRD